MSPRLLIPFPQVTSSDLRWCRFRTWFDRLATNGITAYPSALSLSKGERAVVGPFPMEWKWNHWHQGWPPVPSFTHIS